METRAEGMKARLEPHPERAEPVGVTYRFGSCELDTQRCELRRGGALRHVEPQVFDVLRHLLERRERLVSKEELLDAVWGHRFVTPNTLNSRIKAARQAVGDDGAAQGIIRTVRGRGFRFVADVSVAPASRAGAADDRSAASEPSPRPEPPAAAPGLIARSAALARLVELFDRARAGARQVVFIAGEPGIGKSTLAEAFLAHVARGARVGRGQCVEQRGAGEAYLPVLDAIGRLGRAAGGGEVVRELERFAPTWLVQMPSLTTPEQLAAAEHRSLGASRERMLREMVETLEALSSQTPLVLLLEDLHWSDPSTLDLIAWISQRPEPARLLVLGTLRTADADAELRAAMSQIRRSGRSAEISLERWGEPEVREYCALRYPSRAFSAAVLHLAHQRSEGNPLFLQVLLDAWMEQGAVVEIEGEWRAAKSMGSLAAEIPETLRMLVEHRVERLSEEDQGVLEAGSVVGPEFSGTLAAAALGSDEEGVEARCHALARRGQILRESGIEEFPDGTASARFAFAHHMFRDALYERIPLTRRRRLHASAGERLEVLYGAHVADVANELALHFQLARRDLPAIRYLGLSAEQALRRSAYREAIGHLTTALELFERQSQVDAEDPEALRLELWLRRMLGPALLFTRGWGDPDVERVYMRSREISERLGDQQKLAQVLYGMAYLHEIRGDFHLSEPLLEEALGLGSKITSPHTSIESQELLSCSLFHQGRFTDALRSARAALAVFQPRDRGDAFSASLGMNAGVASHYWEGLALWCLGYPDRALGSLAAAIRVAGHAQLIYMQASAHAQAAELYHFRRELAPLIEHADAALFISERQGYPFHHAIGLTLRGWARVMEGRADEGLAQISRGLEMQRAAGADMERPYGLGLLAEALLHAGRLEEGVAAVDEALDIIARRARAFFWEAELHRLRGELLLRAGAREDAEGSLREALSTAARQEGRSLELRAAMSLCHPEAPRGHQGADAGRRGGRPGAGNEALAILAAIYERFTEGWETADLHEAAAMLAGDAPREPNR